MGVLILLFPILLYVIFILWISHHWYHHKEYQNSHRPPTTKVSVLIPFKNEADNLLRLSHALRAQTYPLSSVEYIFINDHSSDHWAELLHGFKVLHSAGYGKKAALKMGISSVQNELIITLDADCRPTADWLKTIVLFYEEKKSDLIIGPVKLSPVHTFWEKVQALEFQSLAVSAGGAALGRMPMMCNGANLAFRKSLVDTEEDVFNDKYVSGDDMFLLEFAKRKEKKIDYLKSKSAMVSTTPVAWAAFWKQRSRWTSKSGGYSDGAIIVSGLVVLFANFCLLLMPFVDLQLFLIAIVVKAFVDFILLVFSASFFKTFNTLWLYPFLVLIYPVYVFYAVARGFLSSVSGR